MLFETKNDPVKTQRVLMQKQAQITNVPCSSYTDQ